MCMCVCVCVCVYECVCVCVCVCVLCVCVCNVYLHELVTYYPTLQVNESGKARTGYMYHSRNNYPYGQK